MILQSSAGIVSIIALAWIMSENRPRACLKTAAWSVGLQFLLALIFLKLPPVKSVFLEFNRVILALQEATLAGRLSGQFFREDQVDERAFKAAVKVPSSR